MNEPTNAHNKYENMTRSPMARREPPRHERTTALDNSMEPLADRTEIAPTGPSEVAKPLRAAPVRGAARCAPLQEIAETVNRALAYLTDRLTWPYCMPLMAEMCLGLHERIVSTHGWIQLYAEGGAAHPIVSMLHEDLARLLGDSLLDVRDDTPRAMDRDGRRTGEIIPVQEWMAGIGMAHPLAQRCERNGSIVPETVVETVRRNLAELYARPNDEHVRIISRDAPERAWSDGGGQCGSASSVRRRRSLCPWPIVVWTDHGRFRL